MKLTDNSFVIVLVLWAILSGLLLVHTSALQTQNTDLERQTTDYQNQITQLENQIDELEVQNYKLEYLINELEKQLEEQIFQRTLPYAQETKIIKTEVIESNSPLRFVWVFGVNLTVKNYATRDVEGLALSIGYNENEYMATKHLGIVKAGETKTVTLSGCITGGPDKASATLWFKDVKIDTKTFRYAIKID